MFAAIAPEVQVAVVAAVPATIAAVAAAVSARRSADRSASVDEKIGTPNGHGDVVQMLTTLLTGQAGQDNRIARLEGGHHELRQDVARLAGRVDGVERRPVPTVAVTPHPVPPTGE